MSNVWFLMPVSDSPSGGLNNVYKLCEIAKELGIQAKVISDEVYSFSDPAKLQQFWVQSKRRDFVPEKFNIEEIREGDIVVVPELWSYNFHFSVPVRRVTYLQGWSLALNQTFETHYWIYNNPIHTSHLLHSIGLRYEKSKPDFTNFWPATEVAFKAPKTKFSHVSPYFDENDFEYVEPNNKILFLSRRIPQLFEKLVSVFGEDVVAIDSVKPQDLRKKYSEFGIIFLPSPGESLSFPVAEAMLSGCVPVIWESGGPEYFVINGETGMVSPHGDIDSMIQNTKFLMENPREKIKIAEKGFELIQNLWTKERSKIEFYLAYHSTLKDTPS